MSESEIQGVGIDPLIQAGRKAAVDAEAKQQIAKAARELRDQMVLKLYDAGCPIGRIAEAMLISKPRVLQIMARIG